jgi:hypothetical protein
MKKIKVIYYKNKQSTLFYRINYTDLNYQVITDNQIDYRLLGSHTDRIEARLLRMNLNKTNEKAYLNFLSKHNLNNKTHGN